MTIADGTRLGPYEVNAPLGAGGMGEVYRATDTNLKREVAIKVLPALVAGDTERLARFQREAEVLAALNHPHIAAIYGLEKTPECTALVMELVEGEDLSQRIARGAIPVDEALPMARQIAEALEAAHERGIIHRDLKPANIKVRTDGTVKVLDFGLAKALEPAGAPSAEMMNSPTLTAHATQAGRILGTAAYMAPEQARGKAVDRRADIWAFGVVLYEMLTGTRAFLGEDVGHTLARVVEREPDFDALPSSVPARVRQVLRACLQKNPKQRPGDMQSVRLALDGAFETAGSPSATVPSSAVWRRPGPVALVASTVTALALGLLAVLVWPALRAPQSQGRPLVRLSVDLGPDADRALRVSVVLSPDGSRIVYTAKGPDGFHRLYTRRLDQPTDSLLTPEAVRQPNPIFSPNGEWVAYWTGDKLMKVPSQGGEPVAIGATPLSFQGASWGDDDNIVMGSDEGLWRIPSSGGTAELVKGTARSMEWPQVLPGSRSVLVMTAPDGISTADGHDIDVVQLATGERKNLVRGGYWPRYLPTAGHVGHLVYLREHALYGVGFDPGGVTLSGAPTRLLSDVAADTALTTLGGQFAFSDDGTFAYLSGKPQDATYLISWLDASGKLTPVLSRPGVYGSPRISPDGKLLAYTTENSGTNGSDLWVYDLARDTPAQLTFAGEVVDEIAWARDSRHLVYQDGKSLWWTRADGAGQRQLLMDGKELGPTPLGPRPFSFGPSRLAFAPAPGGLPDVWTLPIELTDPERPRPGKPEVFLRGGRVDVDPSFSPDGRFVAYSSTESSANLEVFVRPFPGPGGMWKVSAGQFPTWSPATREIFFLGSDDRIMVASYTIQGDSFSAGVPRVWSPTPIRRHGVQLNFDVAPDGRRVIMFPQPAANASPGNLHATFLLNFFDEVRRRVPVQ